MSSNEKRDLCNNPFAALFGSISEDAAKSGMCVRSILISALVIHVILQLIFFNKHFVIYEVRSNQEQVNVNSLCDLCLYFFL